MPSSEPTVRSATSRECWDLSSFVALVSKPAAVPTVPFADENVEFSVGLSRELFAAPQVGSRSEIVALAYWLRRDPIEAARASFAALQSDTMMLAPRGMVFHVPPANVDTVFVYSWVLSMLVGNVNVVRVSGSESLNTQILLDTIGRLCDAPEFSAVASRNWFVHTGHSDAISEALSAISDVRVVWGGDATVQHFRGFALPPRGRELNFPNRHSLAIINAHAVAEATHDELTAVADRFFNDAYWFDQGACSSPRLIIWYNAAGASVAEVQQRFHSAVQSAISERGYVAEIGSALAKKVQAFESIISQDVISYDQTSNEVTWIGLSDLDRYSRESCGGGIFYEYVSTDLAADLMNWVTRTDQTVSYYGFLPEEIAGLARALNGRGIDRFVPMGHALDFDRIWDGYDLLQEFSVRVAIRPDSGT